MTTKNHTSPSGEDAANGAQPEPTTISWNGFYLTGSRASVDEVHRLIRAAGRLAELESANGASGERAAHCVNTCNFYNKNRPCECPAPLQEDDARTAMGEREAFEAWMMTRELDGLPDLKRDADDDQFYDCFDTQRAWRGWLARSSVATENVAPAQSKKEISAFLSDVMTAAGLVSHGKQSKELASRLAQGCMNLRAALTAEKVAAEPVAWLIERCDALPESTATREFADLMRRNGHKVTPLYAAHPEIGADHD